MITSQAFTDKLNALKELDLGKRNVSPNKEPIFSVDLNTRMIAVPPTFKTLAVKGDTNCETIWFVLERFFDGVDLSKKVWGVQFTNAKRENGMLPASKIDTSDSQVKELIPYFDKWGLEQVKGNPDQTLVLSWQIPYELTKEAGTVTLSLKCFETDNNSNIIYRLSTEPVSFKIKDTPSIDEVSDNLLPPVSTLDDIVSKISDIWNDYQDGINIEYEDILNKPEINGQTLSGDVSSKDLGISYSDLVNKPKITVDGNQYTIGVDKIEVSKIKVDDSLSESSTNPVQNKIIYTTLSNMSKNIEVDMSENLSEAKSYTDTKFEEAQSGITALETSINTHFTNLENDINTRFTNLNSDINNQAVTLGEYIDEKASELNTAISDLRSSTDTTVTGINTQISELETSINTQISDLEDSIDTQSTDLKGYTDSEILKVKDFIEEQLGELTYVPLSILEFKNNVNYAEKNSTINEVIFNWKLSKIPNALKIDETVVESLQEGSYTLATNLTDSKDFILTATDRGNNITAETNIIFTYKVFYGVGAEIFDDSLINSLTGSLQTTYKTDGEISINAGENEYIYYVVPHEYELTKEAIYIGGFNGGLTKQDTSINYNGISYDVWRSDYANLGNTNIEMR